MATTMRVTATRAMRKGTAKPVTLAAQPLGPALSIVQQARRSAELRLAAPRLAPRKGVEQGGRRSWRTTDYESTEECRASPRSGMAQPALFPCSSRLLPLASASFFFFSLPDQSSLLR